jgi:hypothetical protein
MNSAINSFVQNWSESVQVIENVIFKRKLDSNRVKMPRRVLVISTSELDSLNLKKLREDYLGLAMSGPTVSFPIKERADHMLVRVGQQTYDNGYYYLNNPLTDREVPYLRWHRFKKSIYKLPTSRRIEPFLVLTNVEHERLQKYISNILVNNKKVLGRYFHNGTQSSEGFLYSNLALGPEGHNCTSWFANAPLAKDKESFLQTLGAPSHEILGTDPGWWLPFLLSQTEAWRVPFVVYWDSVPLETILSNVVLSGEALNWNFKVKK